ncbi:MAG: GNAT family N-acetyltransferase [Rhizobiaceae bacterium]
MSFGLMSDDVLVGLHPLYVSDVRHGAPGETLLHSGIHRHTGLALRDGLGHRHIAEARAVAVQHIVTLAHSFGVDRIQLNTHNLAPVNRSLDREEIPYFVTDFGFHLGLGFSANTLSAAPGFAVCNADQIVDLTQTEDALWERLTNRAVIRKADKVGLTFDIGRDPGRLDDYWTLATASALRTGEALPLKRYYEQILASFAATENVDVAFARLEDRPVAGLILLRSKQAVSFLAGASDPSALDVRPNDFIHWRSMLAAKEMGASVYRFGPTFPETPADWPISRVSAFKGKFGGKAVPVIQGSLFMKPEVARDRIDAVRTHMAELGQSRTPAPTVAPIISTESVAHHLRLFGLVGAGTSSSASPLVADAGSEGGWIAARRAAERGTPVVLLRPHRASAFIEGAEFAEADALGPIRLRSPEGASRPRTLHPYTRVLCANATDVVVDDDGAAVWSWISFGGSGMLLVGTDLHRDLLRYRQGDPAAAAERPEDLWGVGGERPVHLFEGQLAGEPRDERFADVWCETLAAALCRHGGLAREPILPGSAPGAIVITGDDDQAALSNYAAQRSLLGDLPITYFLHPLTKHDAASLRQFGGPGVEWELHPDALDAPDRYHQRFEEQSNWFQGLLGRRARSVRNHGFLNDGYWGHLPAWLKQGTEVSSNLPGVDGRVLNGSLLPARLIHEGKLTDHWSILTAIGDGVVFIHGDDPATAANRIRLIAESVVASGIPGVIVLNLHPDNVARTASMHHVLHDLVGQGFIAWNLGQCIDWFGARDRSEARSRHDSGAGPEKSRHQGRLALSRNALVMGMRRAARRLVRR